MISSGFFMATHRQVLHQRRRDGAKGHGRMGGLVMVKISHGNLALKSKNKMSSPTPDSLCWKPGKHHDVGKNVFLRKTISLGNGNVKFGFYSRPLELRTIFWQSHFSNNVQCYGNLDWQENMQHIRMYYWKFILMWLVVWNMFYFSIYCE